MKISRFKNPWFWVGIGSVVLTALGVSPEIFTSWQQVYITFISVLQNPLQLTTAILAVLAVFIDPTTKGVTDK